MVRFWPRGSPNYLYKSIFSKVPLAKSPREGYGDDGRGQEFRVPEGSLNGPRKTDAVKTGYSTRAVTRDGADAYLFKLDS